VSRLTGPQRASLLLIVGLCSAVGLFFLLFERIEETHEIGLSGEARINHYLAIERMLTALDVPADSTWGVETLPEEGALLLLDDDPDFRERIAEDVLTWVADGGVAMVGTTTIGENPILEGAGFDVPEPWLAPEDEDTGASEDTDPVADDAAEVAPTRPPQTRSHGSGRITMLPDPGQYQNDALIEDGTAGTALWDALTTESTPTRATLVIRGTSPSLLGTLWKAAWPAMISALVLIGAACLRASRRLGPLLPDPDTDRRSILEHIQATGVFLWRQGHAVVLLDSARRSAGLPPEGKAIKDPRQFTAEVQRLQQEWTLADNHRDH
jgi:hypothetical protein